MTAVGYRWSVLYAWILVSAVIAAAAGAYTYINLRSGATAAVVKKWTSAARDRIARSMPRVEAALDAVESEALSRAHESGFDSAPVFEPAFAGNFKLSALFEPLSPLPRPLSFRGLVERKPHDAEGLRLIEEGEDLEFRRGDPEGALEMYAKAASARYGSTVRNEAAMAAAAAAFKIRDFDDALSFYESMSEEGRIPEINPWTRAAAALREVDCLEELGREGEAFDAAARLARGLLDRSAGARFAGLSGEQHAFFSHEAFSVLGNRAKGSDERRNILLQLELLRMQFERDDGVLEALTASVVPALRSSEPGAALVRSGVAEWLRANIGAKVDADLISVIEKRVVLAGLAGREKSGRIRMNALLGGLPVVAVVHRDGNGWRGIFLHSLVLRKMFCAELGTGEADSPLQCWLDIGENPGMKAADGSATALASVPIMDDTGWARLSAGPSPGTVESEIRSQCAVIDVSAAAAACLLVVGTLFILRRLKAEMDLQKIRSDMISSVSHDLKTPLSIIRSAAETIQMGRISGLDQLGKYVEVIARETRRLEGIAGNVLDSARIDAGRKEYRFESINPGAIVAEVEQSQGPYLRALGFEFSASCSENLPRVRADAQSLVSALYNLLDNAAKYSPEGREISICAREKGGEIAFRVADRGRGIPPEEKARLFQRFYRAKTVLSASSGIGLGLALVLETAKAHGGRVDVEDREGGGTVFSLVLARAGPEDA